MRPWSWGVTLTLELIGVGILILLNAFFVAAEYALVTARRTRIIELHHQGNRRARAVLKITSDPQQFIAAMQLGVTLTSLGIGALGEQALSHAFEAWMATVLAVILAYLLLTFFHVVLGELVPEGVALSAELPPEEALAAVLDSPYTRYPVYRESLDDIIGVLHVRDLFTAVHDRGLAAVRLEEIVRPAYIVPETKDLASLLQEFRKTNNHFAVVVDEYGGMAGICTLEDLLEEIVGEIEDEFDVPDVQIEQIDDDTYRVDGMFPIDEFNERFGTSLPDEDFHTLAGFVFGQLGRAPQPGDDVEHDGTRFDVPEVDGCLIQKMAVTFVERPTPRRAADALLAPEDDLE